MPGKHRDHYRGSHKRTAAAVRAAAYADPATVCPRCGLTLAQRQLTHPNDGWDAGHINPGQIGGPYRAEHSSCNRSAGAKDSHRRRRGLNPSQEW